MSGGEYRLSGRELCPLPLIILDDSDHWWESTDCLEWNCALCQLLLYGLDYWWESMNCLKHNCALCQLLYSVIQNVGGRVRIVCSGTAPSASYYTLWYRRSVGEYVLSGVELSLCHLLFYYSRPLVGEYGLSGV